MLPLEIEIFQQQQSLDSKVFKQVFKTLPLLHEFIYTYGMSHIAEAHSHLPLLRFYLLPKFHVVPCNKTLYKLVKINKNQISLKAFNLLIESRKVKNIKTLKNR